MPGEFIARQGLISRGNVVVTGSLTTSGSLTTTGTITATTLVVQTITSSISSVTGSTNFGSLVSNTHTFTGSLNVTGALAVTTNGVEFQVNPTGVNLGNALTDSHIISGSLRVNPNGLFVSGSGLVGIGTTSPSYTLDVTGTGRFTSNLTTNGLYLISGNAIRTYRGANDYYWQINSDSNNFLNFGTYFANGTAYGTNPKLLLHDNGNIGIGTSNPDNLLEVYGTGTNTTRIRVRGTTNFALFQAQNDSSSAFYLGVDSSTASGFNVGNYSRIIWSGGAYPLVFATNDVERMRFTSDGYFKASNTGTYHGATGLYHEFRNSGNVPSLRLTNSKSSGGEEMLRQEYTNFAPNASNSWFIYSNDTSAARFYVSSDGGIGNFQANNVNLSDERTKKEISPLESYWDKFKAIEIVKFKYKDQTHDDFNIGVIAQQVEQIAPEFVDIDGFGKDNTPEDGVPLKTIYTEDLHHATIKVLQEAMAKIETLETEIEELKARI
jgi:hypothetical protein